MFFQALVLFSILVSCERSFANDALVPNLELKGGAAVFQKQVVDAAKTNGKDSLVMFYAPWCPHCQEAKPKFIEAAKKLENEKNKALVLFNCEDGTNSAVCGEQKVEGYPTIKLFRKDGIVQDFSEDFHQVDSIVNFVKNPPVPGQEKGPSEDQESQSQGQPDQKPMKDVPLLGTSNWTNILEKNQNTLVFFYAPWCPHCQDAKPKIEAAVASLKKNPVKTNKGESTAIAAINCDAAEAKQRCELEKVEGYPTVRYYKKTEMFAEVEEEIDAAAFVKYLSNPPLEKVPPTPIDETNSTESDPQTEQSKDQPKEGEEKQLSESDMKPEAENEKMKDVTYLSGQKEFDNMLKKEKKHQLVMFYAPWCGHCQEAKPHYQAAATETHKKYSDRHLMALNCDDKLNEAVCQKEKVDGFPTFRHYSDGKMIKELPFAPATKKNLLEYIDGLKTYGSVKKEEL